MASCTNPRCEGGWVQVLEGYVEREAPEPELPEGAGPEADAERAKLAVDWKCQRAAAANTWYPCRVCNERLFYRWQGGHLEKDHNREDCDTCVVPGQRRRNPERTLPNPATPAGYRDSSRQEPF